MKNDINTVNLIHEALRIHRQVLKAFHLKALPAALLADCIKTSSPLTSSFQQAEIELRKAELQAPRPPHPRKK